MEGTKLFGLFVAVGLVFSTQAFSESVKTVEEPPTPTVEDKLIPLSDRENLLEDRIGSASLTGDSSLMMSYYRSLMQSFISKDEQANIIKYSIDFLPKLLVYKNYTFAKDLLNHLRFRLDYYSKEPKSEKTQHFKLLNLYEIFLDLLPQETLFQLPLPGLNLASLEEQATSKPSLDNLLTRFILGLTGSPGSLEKSFQNLYIALDMANNLQNVEMYYLISIILLRAYISHKLYSSALVRLNFLYKLFSSVRFSDYYRIQILMYFIEVHLMNHNVPEAYTMYLRARDMLKYNMAISSEEVLKLNRLLDNFTPQITAYTNERGITGLNGFLDKFIDTSTDD